MVTAKTSSAPSILVHQSSLVKTLLALALLPAMWSAPAFSQQPFLNPLPEQLKMHRLQSGMPNKDGWYDANSTEGRFRVLLPVPFNDFTVRVKEKDGREVVCYCIGSKSAEGYKFTAVEYPQPELRDADLALKEFVSSFKNDTKKIANERYFKFQKHPAADFRMNGEKTSAFARVIVMTDRKYLMIVEYPEGTLGDVTPLVPLFFDSLQMQGPDLRKKR